MYYTTPNSKVGSIFNTTQEELETPVQGSDRVILVCVFMLMTVGAIAVYSSIAYFAQSHGTSAATLVSSHIVKLGIAFIAMIVASKLNYRVLARFSRIAVVFSWILLIAVMVYGDMVFGARRSLSIAGFSFQPSSFAAMALILHVAVLLHEKQEYIKDFKRAFVPILIWVTITCFLIALEDFSSAALLMGISICMMFVGRISAVQLFGLILIGIIGGSTLVMSSPERTSRVTNYITQVKDINSENLESSSGYQAQQAHIAIARGGLIGVGIGKSTQRDFLPAPYNDFIFAIIAEEYGMIGSAAVMLIFIVILWRGVGVIARFAPDSLGTLLALGATLMITLYGFVNAAVATGLFPVTGLPMPFISYGGTSMLFAGVMVGILLNISKHNLKTQNRFYNG
ncbi:FtsW/RodA/SpoVE family cell cycle protein [Rhodohalobacter halophilus]|uniref:FtsW/RodA/SpoVE family cell cycle protein n=1 Tax=Rhodohalobacter halophilus TaxID=1812810 RepID=UPI0009FFE266|nr:putative peptidoglycan glycosyltransferase FtsW [Rhodohalobacter halophilus]